MAVNRYTTLQFDDFNRAQTYTTTPTGAFGWRITVTAAGGTPTYLTTSQDGGAAVITLAATNEVENVSFTQNDVLNYDWRALQWVEWTVRSSTGFTSGDTCFFGVGNARNDAVASITEKAVFKLVAATSTTAVVIDTKDGTTAISDIATGNTLSSTYKKFTIDFTNGIADVRFYINGARVATSQTFNLSALTSGNNCQLMAQLQKTATTSVSDFQISRVALQYTVAEGA